MKIEIRILQPDESATLENVEPDVFDNPINPESCKRFFEDKHHYNAVALVDSRIIGMATAVEYFHPDKPVELWINEVGVAPDYQRQGIGKQLMEKLKELGRELGCEEVWVLTELNNDAANGLYSSVGSNHENIVYHTISLSDET